MTKLNKNNSIDLTQNIMAEIKSGQVKMKPKIYFVMGSILTGAGIASSLFATLLITSMTFFRLRKFGLEGLLWPGRPFFAPMPLFILLISLLILWGGMELIKRYDFSYKHNFSVIAIAIITLILSLGFLFDHLGVNQQLQRRPQLKHFYQQRQPDFSPKPGAHQPRRLHQL